MKHESAGPSELILTSNALPRVIYGAESYRRFAEDSGFRQETLEKVIRIGDVLAAVASEPVLSAQLALKGGTAINLATEPIRRLSVDLDFNFVGGVDRHTMQSARPKVLERLSVLCTELGYRTISQSETHGSSTWSLNYKNSLGTQDRIEIDINWITRVPLGPLQVRPIWQPAGIPRPIVSMVSNEELIAGKLRALIDRVAARDVFDAGFLPQLLETAWPSPRAKALFILFSGTLNRPLFDYSVDRLDRLTEAEYKTKLVPVLSVNTVPLREQLIADAKRVLAPMLDLDANQREFIERLQRGEYQPDLLLPFDTPLAERLTQHPALQWKARHAREHSRKKL